VRGRGKEEGKIGGSILRLKLKERGDGLLDIDSNRG